MNKIFNAFFFLLLGLNLLSAQQVYLLRYAGANYLTDPNYRLDIYNPSNQSRDLGGYLLVSRQFVVLLPRGSTIGPRSSLRLGKGDDKINLPFQEIEDFIIRIPATDEQGDYVALLDRDYQLVDAFYFSLRPNVNFLPDKGELITFQNKKIPFSLPAEQDPVWSYLPVAADPAMAFARVGGAWQPVSRNRNTLPATEYGDVEANYVEGIVSLQGLTIFERGSNDHLVERSLEGGAFEMIGKLSSQGNSSQPINYQFFDDETEADRRYYYRLKNIDRFGFEVYSELVEVHTDELPKDFSMSAFVGHQGSGATLNVRFSTREAYQVRIKLMDEQFRETALLFFGKLKANGQYLVKFTDPLPTGKYYIIADTPERRFYEELIVNN